MNQRTLKVLSLTTGGGHITTGFVSGLVVDLVAGDGVTTNAWTFANVGRREIKFWGFVHPGATGTTVGAMASYTAYLQTSTTGAFTAGTITTNSASITCTTFGPTNEGHFYTNDRYLRPLHNCLSITSCGVVLMALVEQRAS
jgi:hypothetical protein